MEPENGHAEFFSISCAHAMSFPRYTSCARDRKNYACPFAGSIELRKMSHMHMHDTMSARKLRVWHCVSSQQTLLDTCILTLYSATHNSDCSFTYDTIRLLYDIFTYAEKLTKWPAYSLAHGTETKILHLRPTLENRITTCVLVRLVSRPKADG